MSFVVAEEGDSRVTAAYWTISTSPLLIRTGSFLFDWKNAGTGTPVGTGLWLWLA